ncbi:SUKH-4 family immunity protein [Streptomyces mirabilis]|uniref:SUKH-4 family immunity protein n=1 Tax=Streptomyces mirabilis TaxID=68239 RepID=UPI00368B35DE
MVTFAQAQERAEEWINGEVPGYQHREVRVREFELGFVVWAEDRVDGPRSDGGAQRLVIARDSGEATLWPGLPVGEVIRRYEEEYGAPQASPEVAPAPPARVDLNQTSFLLSPPEWLQEAADKLGIADRRTGATAGGANGAGTGAGLGAGSGAGSHAGSHANGASAAGGSTTPSPSSHSSPSSPSDAPPWPAAAAGDERDAGPRDAVGAPGVPASATPWAGTDTAGDGGEDRSVPLPATVFAPQLTDVDDKAGPGAPPGATPDTKTALMSGGSQLPGTAQAPAVDGRTAPPAYGYPQAGPGAPGMPGTPPPGVPVPGGPVPGGPVPGVPVPGGPVPGVPAPGGPQGTPPAGPPAAYGFPQGPAGAPGTPPPPPPPPGYGYPQGQAPVAPPRPLPPNAGDIADAATSKAQAPPRGARGGGVSAPPPPSAPGVPGARPGSAPPPPPPPPSSGPGAPGTPAGGYVPTQLVSQLGPNGPGVPGAPAAPGAPQPPGGTPPGGVHHAATMLAGPPAGPPVGPPVAGPGVPPPPQAPGMPPGAPQPMPGQPMPGQPMPGQPMSPGQQPPAYGYPQAGQPTVGPGYQAVLRYRAQDGSEQQLIRRSAPGTPHPEWQILHELRAMNVPPQQVLELHTELESCELPGAYCARMIRESWPQARITSIAPYGTDHASRQQGMHQLLAHQGELHQVADGPARPAPVRAPIPPVQPAPPVPPEAIGQELAAAFGPGLFRFDQAAVSRQGVPNIVAHTLVVAGLPVDMGPFFWAQAQPGRPVPTLAELAQERGVQPAADAGSYLVMGSDFGKAICVQYGTANIVAVPVEAGPGGASVPPQFVNTGLPEFARCLALLGRMWRLRFGLNQEQAGRWTVDFQAQLASLDPAALGSPESWWSVLLEQMWDGLL